jgi:hypothetical protein
MRGKPTTLEDIALRSIEVHKLVNRRRGLPAGPERDLVRRQITTARNTLLCAIRSWRRRNEVQP